MRIQADRIVAIIVTRNRSQLLRECVESIIESEVVPDIIVIDNHSSDNTKDVVEELNTKKKLSYYDTGGDNGPAYGFSLGIRKAYEVGYDFFWLMDDDTEVKKDSLLHLIEFAEKHSGFGFLSSLALWKDGRPCIMNYHSIDSRWQEEKCLLLENAIRISAATFVSFFISRDVVRDVGLPIKQYFIWGDDTEYTQRVSSAYKCYYVPKSQVLHKMNSNTGSTEVDQIDDLERIQRLMLSVRNDGCTYRRMGGKAYLKYVLHLCSMIKHAIKKDSKYKFIKLRMILKGFVYGIVFSPRIEHMEEG